MKLDCPAQQLLISSLRNQIEQWRNMSKTPSATEEDKADFENDIGYAFTVLSELESSFQKEFGIAPE